MSGPIVRLHESGALRGNCKNLDASYLKKELQALTTSLLGQIAKLYLFKTKGTGRLGASPHEQQSPGSPHRNTLPRPAQSLKHYGR